jgi:hypothetical protein
MPKDIAWGPVGRPKAPHRGGTFAADTPQVFYSAYILPLLTKYAQNDKISSMSMSAVSTPILNNTTPPTTHYQPVQHN